jgi:mannitol 2-dehydrogenase
VDRITPGTTDDVRRAVEAQHGIVDRWPVRAESYLQWVLEDNFPTGRPDWESAGVQLVTDVEPYELMKLRLLNASHQVMSYPALLAGLTWVDEASHDPQIVELLQGWMREARTTLSPVPGVDLDAYCATLIERFGSTAVRDTLARQVVSSSDRLPKFVIPVLAARAGGEPNPYSVFVLAAWSVWLADSIAGSGITDSRKKQMFAAATREEAGEVAALLDVEVIFGAVGKDPQLREAYWSTRTLIRARGVRDALATVMKSAA